MDAMAAEDAAGRAMNSIWNEVHRERDERKAMAIQDTLAHEYEDEVKYGAGASEGNTSSEESEGHDSGREDEEDRDTEGCNLAEMQRLSLRNRRRRRSSMLRRVVVDNKELPEELRKRQRRTVDPPQYFIIPDREPWHEMMIRRSTVHLEAAVRDVADALDTHHREINLCRKARYERQREKVEGEREAMVGLAPLQSLLDDYSQDFQSMTIEQQCRVALSAVQALDVNILPPDDAAK
jgi:hypothetical protein